MYIGGRRVPRDRVGRVSEGCSVFSATSVTSLTDVPGTVAGQFLR